MSTLFVSECLVAPANCFGFRIFCRFVVFVREGCSSSPTSGTTFTLVRGDFALTSVQSLIFVALTGWYAGYGLAAVKPAGMWGGGSRTLAGGPSACSLLDLCGSSLPVPRSRFVGSARGGLHLFMFRGAGTT